jgi:hypothetical protein
LQLDHHHGAVLTIGFVMPNVVWRERATFAVIFDRAARCQLHRRSPCSLTPGEIRRQGLVQAATVIAVGIFDHPRLVACGNFAARVIDRCVSIGSGRLNQILLRSQTLRPANDRFAVILGPLRALARLIRHVALCPDDHLVDRIIERRGTACMKDRKVRPETIRMRKPAAVIELQHADPCRRRAVARVVVFEHAALVVAERQPADAERRFAGGVAEDDGGFCGDVHSAASKNCGAGSISRGAKLARTRAAAIGGQTLLPHFETCSVLEIGEPSGLRSMM